VIFFAITCILSVHSCLWIGTADGTLYIYDLSAADEDQDTKRSKPSLKASSLARKSKNDSIFISSPDLTSFSYVNNVARSSSPSASFRSREKQSNALHDLRQLKDSGSSKTIIDNLSGQRQGPGQELVHRRDGSAKHRRFYCSGDREQKSSAETILQQSGLASSGILSGIQRKAVRNSFNSSTSSSVNCTKNQFGSSISSSGEKSGAATSDCNHTDRNCVLLPPTVDSNSTSRSVYMRLQSKIKVSERPVKQLVDAR
jgi:hypothetical protein